MLKVKDGKIKSFLFLLFGLPNLLVVLLFGYPQLSALVFYIRFFRTFDDGLKDSVFVLLTFIGMTCINLFLFYRITIKQRLLPLLFTVPAIILTFFIGIYALIFVSFPGFDPRPQFQFAAACEQMVNKGITWERVESLHGYIREEGSQIENWRTHSVTYQEVEEVQRLYAACNAPLSNAQIQDLNYGDSRDTAFQKRRAKYAQCVETNKGSRFIYRPYDIRLHLYSIPDDTPQIYCLIEPSNEGMKARLSSYFD